MKLKDKKVFITGASTGIGAAIAVRLSKDGANLYLAGGKNEVSLNETIENCKTNGVNASGECVDLSNLDTVPPLLNNADQFLGGLDILINCAGLRSFSAVGDFTKDEIEKLFKINSMSAFYLSSLSAKIMLKQGKGQILNIGSTAGEAGVANFTLYCSTKGAMHLMTKGMAVELGPQGIRVNALAPGTILSETVGSVVENDKEKEKKLLATIPSGRFGTVEEVADCAAFIVSDEADYMNGAIILLDGGRLSV
jgi:NAD(P)-dependent dehydrogenase (short-subunit alcohol dehydrogenase family)